MVLLAAFQADAIVTPRPTVEDASQGDGWVPYRDAAAHAGVPAKTVRNWHQAGKVPRRYVPGPNGREAWVPLDAVLALAGKRRAGEQPAGAGDAAVALREAVAALHDLALRLQAAEARASKAEAEVAALRSRLRVGRA